MTDAGAAPTAPTPAKAPPTCRCKNEYCHHHTESGCTLDGMFVLTRALDGMPEVVCGWCAYVGLRRGEYNA